MYVDLLEKQQIIPSMSRPGNPYDNAFCESFLKTLKREEIYANRYENLEDLRANLEEFIEQYYNQQRLHSALGYVSPAEFEAATEREAGNAGRVATLKFSPHGDSCRSEEATGGRRARRLPCLSV